MDFNLIANASGEEITSAVNYLLANINTGLNTTSSGQVVSGGNVVGYVYKYLWVKYATSYDGSVGFSNVPTNATYFGLHNSNSSTESTNPADYVWSTVSGGFGVTKFLYYLTTGGRQIQFAVATATPNTGWLVDSGSAIDLDVTSSTNAVANFAVVRSTTSSTFPSDAECIAAIGRTPRALDICTVNYNSGLQSAVYKFDGTNWITYTKYVTVEQLFVGATPPIISGITIQAGTAGALVNPDGTFAFGNSTANVVNTGSNIIINGFASSGGFSNRDGDDVSTYIYSHNRIPPPLNTTWYTVTPTSTYVVPSANISTPYPLKGILLASANGLLTIGTTAVVAFNAVYGMMQLCARKVGTSTWYAATYADSQARSGIQSSYYGATNLIVGGSSYYVSNVPINTVRNVRIEDVVDNLTSTWGQTFTNSDSLEFNWVMSLLTTFGGTGGLNVIGAAYTLPLASYQGNSNMMVLKL